MATIDTNPPTLEANNRLNAYTAIETERVALERDYGGCEPRLLARLIDMCSKQADLQFESGDPAGAIDEVRRIAALAVMTLEHNLWSPPGGRTQVVHATPAVPPSRAPKATAAKQRRRARRY